ncbi:hypothetical protein MtrunA17_Chr6g0479131 [Medicago truncatula]|uniref:Transmembrane protein n=1 Tax=Medicago truncatula TaxID=3880 RepID=A0A396HG62_MEDTR|nr:hypothetical protein MtrunA17_Chr6g0479131 [Medicago truncatula]
MKNNKKDEGVGQKGIPIHSQVMKIKQESEKIFDWSPGKPEIRPVLREISRRISRSPLGISGQAISVEGGFCYDFLLLCFIMFIQVHWWWRLGTGLIRILNFEWFSGKVQRKDKFN